jgi:hypothetical protein
MTGGFKVALRGPASSMGPLPIVLRCNLEIGQTSSIEDTCERTNDQFVELLRAEIWWYSVSISRESDHGSRQNLCSIITLSEGDMASNIHRPK